MTVGDILVRIIPFKARLVLGCWALRQACRSELLLKWYLGVLHGKIPKKLGLASDHCYYDYMGRRIKAPHLAADIFIEIFEDRPYEYIWEPQEGDIVMDIGAHVGMFTVKTSLAVGDRGKVIAIEPSPENCEWLLDNCEGLDNVTLVRKAAMSKNGKAKLYYHGASGAANSLLPIGKQCTEVETITVDNLVKELRLEKVDIIKIDVEGTEVEVLEGAEKTLARGTKLLISAYHLMADGRPELPYIIALLDRANYKTIIKNQRYVFAEPEEVAV